MHSATLSGLSVATKATTRSLGSAFPSLVALNIICFPLLRDAGMLHCRLSSVPAASSAAWTTKRSASSHHLT